MDTRLSIRTMGLKTGDAHIIRNAGGIVTEDSLRSLIVSHHLLGTEEIMVINHTDCGLMQTSEQDLRTRIQNRTGTAAVFAGLLLRVPEHRRKRAAPVAKAAIASVDSGKGRCPRLRIRSQQRIAPRNQEPLTDVPQSQPHNAA